ncbi:hypothetical protein SmJEL517_g02766 [Synchytrium microbalum]|uniref:Nitrogen permease regulator 2 n=1 Tax=Synchytrium microbalum TaxID=1806994 RepID=A0A507C5N3_9FUNG|nr:uncharacterized protein SmJEL517_g02766 [Synchytrium microbalum]TPX34678.1 hypothetical protein SmJEL517_g02766 [Synchytrium microbalum]
MDNFTGFPTILGIVYAEFHATFGPKVTFEVPEGIMTSNNPNLSGSLTINSNNTPASPLMSSIHSPLAMSPTSSHSPTLEHVENTSSNRDAITVDFDSLSEYIIPKRELFNQLLIVSTPKYRVIGHPISVEGEKYQRNALLFNMCFVLAGDADTSAHEPVVAKMARLLRLLEVESEFLSNPDTKQMLPNIMEHIMEGLNSYFECRIPIGLQNEEDMISANTIDLKLFPRYPEPPVIHDYEVPVLIIDLVKIMEYEKSRDTYWDLTLQKVIPRIDGVSHVRRIADLADVAIDLVRLSVQHLLYVSLSGLAVLRVTRADAMGDFDRYYGCVKMVDIFQFSNIYAVTGDVNMMLAKWSFQQDCLNFVTLQNQQQPSFASIFRLYCGLRHGLTVREWIEENRVAEINIDIRRFFIYGLVKGFVYRVHRYPVWTSLLDDDNNSNSNVVSTPSAFAIDLIPPKIQRLLDGTHHFDDLCTRLSLSARELEEFLAGVPVICK